MKVEFTPPGRHKSLTSFRKELARVAPELSCDAELEGRGGPLGKPLEAFGTTLSNRFAIHPMEGWDGNVDGTPSELTLARWRNFGVSGAALIWGGEAFAVQADGRANPNQLWLNPAADVAAGMAALRNALDEGRRDSSVEDRFVAGLQLTHSGRFARPTAAGPAPRIAHHHPILDGRLGLDAQTPLLTDGELEGIGVNYVRAAEHAQAAGFDFVDVKACHGYLMHELLAARTRPGPYGGSFEGRTRLFRRIVAGIRRDCPGLGIATRVSIADVIPFTKDAESGRGTPASDAEGLPYQHGFGVDPEQPCTFALEEPFLFLELCRELGLREISITAGSPYTCPHLQRPATYPPSDGYLPPADPLIDVARHLSLVRACKRAFPELVFVGAGYTYFQDYLLHVAQHELRAGHVDLVGLGRMVLSYPTLPADALNGLVPARKRICRTFSDCTTAPRHGLVSGCYPLDPRYKALPEAAEVRRIKDALAGRSAKRDDA